MAQEIPERIPEIQDKRLDYSYRRKEAWHNDLTLENTIGDAGETFQGDTVLELACGCGEKTFELSKYFRKQRVIGVDIDEESIAIAQEKYAPLVDNLEYHVADAYELSQHFSDMPIIMIQEALHHFDDLGRLIGEIKATLAPGGYFTGRDFDRTRIYEVLESQKQTEFYERVKGLRTEKTDEKCMDYMVKKGLLHMKRDDILLVMSLMAAYTKGEFVEVVEQQGFKGELYTGAKGTFNFFLRKPKETLLQRLLKKRKK